MRVLSRLALVPVAALLVLTACATDDEPATPPDSTASQRPEIPRATVTPEPFRGVPEAAARGVEPPGGVIVGEAGLVQVITYGSSSNPTIVRSATASGQTVTVDLSDVPGRPATMDYQPTTSAFVLPEGVATNAPITLVLGDQGTVTLDSGEPGTQARFESRD